MHVSLKKTIHERSVSKHGAVTFAYEKTHAPNAQQKVLKQRRLKAQNVHCLCGILYKATVSYFLSKSTMLHNYRDNLFVSFQEHDVV